MASSLKAKFPQLARILGETPDTLYGWQRSLVRAGLLDAVPGRGPGSGVTASPETMAQFLIGVCCQATRAENVPLGRGMASAVHPGTRCALTGKETFGEAFSAILADEALASRVNDVRFSPNAKVVMMKYDDTKDTGFLMSSLRNRKNPTAISFSATIYGSTLVSIVKEVLT